METKRDNIIDMLLSIEEWENFDFKRALIKPSRLLESVVAFANTEGGSIALGVEDPKKATGDDRLIGISEGKDNVSEFKKLIDKEITPFLQKKDFLEIDFEKKTKEKDKILLLRIYKSEDIHSLKNGDTFVRKGDQNVKIGNVEITRLKYEKGSISFENEPSGIRSLEDFDSKIYNEFKKDNNSQSENDFQFLKDNSLAIQRRDEFELTKGGVLLFDKNPTISLKGKFGIKISHYYGTEPNFSGEPNFVQKPFTIEGPLLTQIEKACQYFNDVVRKSPPKLKGSTFQPTMLIPPFAFQEAITNAVIHRNYSIQNDIQVRFFDDHIEIESPGSYPGYITPSNIRTERFARNPMIQRALNKFTESPNLDIGEGVDRMFQAMKDSNLYDPQYTPTDLKPNSVLLTLLNMQKISYWDTVSKYLDDNFKITNSEARAITGIKDTPNMSRILKAWVKQKLLFKVESKFKGGVYYRKYNSNEIVPFAKGYANGQEVS